MAEHVMDYDGWAEDMQREVGAAWSLGMCKAVAKMMHGRKREEVIRCRDCKRYEWREHLGRSYCHGEYPTEPDGFCKWGERKEVDA